MSEPTSDLELGDPAFGSDAQSVTYEASESIDVGDFVDIDSDKVRPANSGDSGVVIQGIAGTSADGDGDVITVYTGGLVTGNAAGSLSAGVEIGATTTDGQVASGSNAKGVISLTPSGSTGGAQNGGGLGTNAAVFDLG